MNWRQSSRQTGDRGEDLALRYLARKGYEALERTYRTRHGEIDMIVQGKETLVFVEVKLRRGSEYGDPMEAITPKKQARIQLVAEQYLAERGEEFAASFDVVGILQMGAGRPEVRHVENAF